jgi:DNA-binding NarL/FixJ family response regulator
LPLYRCPRPKEVKMKSEDPARVIVADDHVLIREGFRTILSKEADVEVVDEAKTGREALNLCRNLRPDLVLMDVRMPEMDGLAATRAIKAERPSTSVLILTTYENPDYLFEAIRSGAVGYVLKDATKGEILGAVRGVLSGEAPLDQNLSLQLLQRLILEHRQEPRPPLRDEKEKEKIRESLTARELEILELLIQGQSNQEIARYLTVSLSTVKTHIQHIIAKLEVSDRTQAAVRAIRLGLFPS